MTQSEVRMGVVGTGGFANFAHMPGYQAHPKARIVGVCDIILERAQAAAKAFDATFVTDNYNELIERDDIDAIDIVAPNNVHIPIALAAIAAGKHVICEKPLAMSLREAQQLIDAAKETGAKTGVNFTYRGHPAARYAKQLIAEGDLGKIYHVNAFYMQGWLVDPKTPMAWRLQKDITGTGVLGDLASHIIDLSMWFTNARITSVVGDARTFVDERPLSDGSGMGKVDVDDGCDFLVRYDNGAMGTFVSSRYGTARANYQRIEVYGSTGALVYDWEDKDHLQVALGDDAARYRWHTAPVPDSLTPRDGGLGWTENVSNFIDAILEDKEMVPNFEAGLANQAVLDAVATSAENRSWVKVA
jgi:predicted dehydrogenase